jgi:hypothetical protein
VGNVRVLSQLDLVFCIDLTGSMSGFLASAQQHMKRVLEAFAERLHGGLRVAIVGYRDHCDGDKLLEVHDFDGKPARVAKAIGKLSVSGGGDAPEAVYSGLLACCRLAWAKGSYRVVVLVGDAPPHGVGAPGDSLPRDPTGMDLDGMANKLEADDLFVHALSMQPNDRLLETSFRRLSISTSGGYHEASAGAAMTIVEEIAGRLLQDIDLDGRIYTCLRDGVRVAEPAHDNDVPPSRAQLIAGRLGCEERDVHAGMMRLRRRRLLDGLEA